MSIEQQPAGDGDALTAASHKRPVRARRRSVLISGVILLAVVVTVGAGIGLSAASAGDADAAPRTTAPRGTVASPQAPTPEADLDLPSPPELSPEQIAELPAADYDAVIAGLIPYRSIDVSGITQTFTLAADAPVFGDDYQTPVARVPATNFLGDPTIIVPVQRSGDWALVMTPSRQVLPSQADGDAPAQTVGWVPRSALTPHQQLDAHILVSEEKQTLTIVRDGEAETFPIGVGTPETPTPIGTTGYIQARYDDPGQAAYTIQLTSLHATAADEPFGGKDGGLIGVHYNDMSTGAVSHGCIRLSLDALVAVNRLPLGTPVVVTGQS